MRRALVHVNLDPGGDVELADMERAVAALRAEGFEVIASDLDRFPPGRREIELIIDDDDPAALRRLAETACAAALPGSTASSAPVATAVGFMSSGRAEDAEGIVHAFGLRDELREVRFQDEDVAILVVEPGVLESTAPMRLQTALEAALNREVHFVAAPAPASPASGA